MYQPLVAVSSDVRADQHYFWHAAPETYLRAAIEGAGVFPVILPSLGRQLDIGSLFHAVDGVLITGSASNVHPSRYGKAASAAHEPHDPARDATVLPLIIKAIEHSIPLLAICRGMQELNVALGGTLATEIQELEGRMDHRAPVSKVQDERFAIRQSVTIRRGSLLASILANQVVQVNSLHRQAIDRLADRLVVEATAQDGTIEAATVKDAGAFALAVQWHPEYWVGSDSVSDRIFGAFGNAVRDHAANRLNRQAAE